jgi:hypothetical protein
MEYERAALPIEFMKFCSGYAGVLLKPFRERFLLAPIRISTKAEPIVEDYHCTILDVIRYEIEYGDS